MLNSVGSNGPVTEADLITFVTGGLRVSDERARRHLAELLEAGLLTSAAANVVDLSDAGRELWTRVSAEIRPVTEYLFEGFSDDEKTTVAMVLNRVAERADAALA